MIVLIHNILPPYRVPLFNSIAQASGGDFMVLLSRDTHPGRRSWSVPWNDVSFANTILPGWHVDFPTRHFDFSYGVRSELERIKPAAVVLAGWDLPSAWIALAWCRRNRIPAIAWVESWSASGQSRGHVSTAVRQAFLRRCAGAIVPGEYAGRFVRELAPELPVTSMPNSVDTRMFRHLAAPEGDEAALFLGELSPRKGFDLVLRAAPCLLEQHGKLLVAGTGVLEPELERLSRRDHRVTWLGFTEGEARSRAMAASALVMAPSRRDPWPLVPAEGIVSGRPVVLGPGVGSAADLSPLGDFVGLMRVATSEELIRVSAQVSGIPVSDEARSRFSPEEGAAAFVEATLRASP